jgi:hypothetical protein
VATVFTASSLNTRRIQITQGNIDNNHIYLSSIIDFFPTSSIGGRNKKLAAPELLELSFGSSSDSVRTDIAGDKKIPRVRGEVIKNFFESAGVRAGDFVDVTRNGPVHYSFAIVPR